MTIIENTKVQKQITLHKPSIDDLISSFTEHSRMITETAEKNNEAIWTTIAHPDHQNTDWVRMSNQNFKYLTLMEYEDYDLFNFDRLIASIELNSEKHFNMASFMSVLNMESYKEEHDLDEDPEIFKVDINHLDSMKKSNLFNNTTKEFNCDTVGCIAGFCVANAVEWNDSKWSPALAYNIGYHDIYEHIACNFLNIPIQVGKKLFYGEPNSFWSYLAYHHGSETHFLDLNWDEETMGCGCNDTHYTDTGVDLNSISSEAAVRALQMIRNQEVVFTAKNNYQAIQSR
jgi:hypothetical protein